MKNIAPNECMKIYVFFLVLLFETDSFIPSTSITRLNVTELSTDIILRVSFKKQT